MSPRAGGLLIVGVEMTDERTARGRTFKVLIR
jgi:hypothetical protein